MQHRSRMRIKRDYRSRHVQLFGALYDTPHDQLMRKMQSIEHAKGQDSRRVDGTVIYFTEDSHRMYVTQADCKRSVPLTQQALKRAANRHSTTLPQPPSHHKLSRHSVADDRLCPRVLCRARCASARRGAALAFQCSRATGPTSCESDVF